MEPGHRIRIARLADAKDMAEIYRPHVLDSPTSFENEPPAAQEFGTRIEEGLKKFPWLVYESKGEIAGYAYASLYRTRCAYAWSVESSVYVHAKYYRKGVGTALYRCLFELLKEQGAANVFAGITLPNPASVRIHESMGFVPIGVYKDIGFKMGRWWDVGWWQLRLQKPAAPGELGPVRLDFESPVPS